MSSNLTTCALSLFTYKKATLFGDDTTAQHILNTSDPSVAKSLGRKIHNFDAETWRNSQDSYMRTAIHAKFTQNSKLGDFLRGTGDTTIVEASPHDRYWGAGFSLDDNELWDPSKWKGANTLGRMLGELREIIKKN